jgi:hypothetical protein
MAQPSLLIPPRDGIPATFGGLCCTDPTRNSLAGFISSPLFVMVLRGFTAFLSPLHQARRMPPATTPASKL